MLLFAHMIPETYEASSILYISVNKIKTILENYVCVDKIIPQLGYKQIEVSQYSRIAKNMCFSKKSNTMRRRILQNGLCK